MSRRAIHTARTRTKLSRDCALVMCFYMRLEKHACKAMSQDRLLALAVVSSDQFINFSTFVRHMLFFTVRIRELSDLVRRRISSILGEQIVCLYSKSESEGSRISFAGGCFSILDDIGYCDSAATCSWCRCETSACGRFADDSCCCVLGKLGFGCSASHQAQVQVPRDSGVHLGGTRGSSKRTCRHHEHRA